MGEIKLNTRLSNMVFEAMNKRDFSDIDPYLDDDVCIDFPGVELVEGRRKFHIFMKALLRGFPELEFTIQEVVCTEESSTVVWTNAGIDTDFNPYSNRGMTLIHFKNGKIVFISDYFKDTSFTNK